MATQMTMKALENLILRLHKAGASYVKVGEVEVSFGPDAKPVGFETEEQIGQRIEMELDEAETDDIEQKQRKREALAKLMYAHS